MKLTTKERVAKVKERIYKLNRQIDVERANLRVIEAGCDHPNRYETSCMGDNGWHCPDCGWSR